jgi:hypothetical protein
MKLRMLKLITGEVVLGEEVSTGEMDTTLKNPVALYYDPIQQGVALMPYDNQYTEEIIAEKTFSSVHIFDPVMTVGPTFTENYAMFIKQLEEQPDNENSEELDIPTETTEG